MTWDDKLVEHITAEVLRRLERPSQKPRLFLLSDMTASDLTSYLKGYFSVHTAEDLPTLQEHDFVLLPATQLQQFLGDKPSVPDIADSLDLTVHRLIHARLLQECSSPATREILISPRAIITPQAHDWLREKGIALLRHSAEV